MGFLLCLNCQIFNHKTFKWCWLIEMKIAVRIALFIMILLACSTIIAVYYINAPFFLIILPIYQLVATVLALFSTIKIIYIFIKLASFLFEFLFWILVCLFLFLNTLIVIELRNVRVNLFMLLIGFEIIYMGLYTYFVWVVCSFRNNYKFIMKNYKIRGNVDVTTDNLLY